MEIKINTYFKKIDGWKDTTRRSEHILDRMKLRGIGINQIKEAVQKGAKKLRKDGSIISKFRWFIVIYREFKINDIKKIYPITVMEV